MSRGNPVLIYRSTCQKCRALSKLVVLFTLGWVRRVPLSSVEAGALYEAHSVRPGKLAIVGYGRVFIGRDVFRGLAELARDALRSRLSKSGT